MMRGTTLNACETSYNMKENEYRLIESYEERLLVEAMQTGSKCPRAVLYLDLGLCPARFVVKKYKLNFLHYILNQHEESLLFRFFIAQVESPSKGDWVSETKKWIIEYKIANTFEEVKTMKKSHNEKLVRDKVKEEAFQYLKNKIKSKGSSIDYGNQLEMQAYLKPNRVLTFQEQIYIFSYRSEMNELSLKYLQENEICACTNELNNIHLFECTILNNKKAHELIYEDILYPY